MSRLRRSELSTPASSPKMIAKAAVSEADMVFLDLEDAVSPQVRPAARQNAIEGLTTLDWGSKTRAIRMNAIDTDDGFEDLLTIIPKAGNHLDVIVVPKANSAADIVAVDRLLTYLEHKYAVETPIGIEILIETVHALNNVKEIAVASPRVESLIVGVGDLAASQGARVVGEPQDAFVFSTMWLYARSKVSAAAHAAGVDAIDGPFVSITDIDAYRQMVREARIMGFSGKWAIHPNQIAPANEGFGLQDGERKWMADVLEHFGSARDAGTGAVALDGELIDAAHLLMVDRLNEMDRRIQEKH